MEKLPNIVAKTFTSDQIVVMDTATCSICGGGIWLDDGLAGLADYVVNGEVVCSRGCLEEKSTLWQARGWLRPSNNKEAVVC